MLPITPFLIKALLITTYRLTIDNNVVQLNHGGRVRGTILRSEEGNAYYSFKGIPYAEPPVGALRFKAPIAKKPWTEEFDATKEGPTCPQVDTFFRPRGWEGQEDCLIVNVYTPELPEEGMPNPKRDVLVYIHGGGFMLGSGNDYIASPDRFIDTNNVFVGINYRLDALGFLSTGDDAAPGNYGLLDQSLALRWVKDNIEAFGGNPDSVTIFGYSAGGASVSYQLLSPLSKGLFHRAAPMSGTALSPWPLATNPRRWANYVATHTGCPTAPSSDLVDCLRTKPVEEIVKGMPHYGDRWAFPMPFVPSVDGRFITETPSKIFDAGINLNSVPVLTGVTEEEGAGFLGWIKLQKPDISVTSDEFINFVLNTTISGEFPDIIEQIKQRFLSPIDRNDEDKIIAALMKILSDGWFKMDHLRSVNKLTQAGADVYTYSYDFRLDTPHPLFSVYPQKYGVQHGEDLLMYFNVNWEKKLHFNARERKMARFLTQMLSNFAKTGNPDPTHQLQPAWPKSTPNRIEIFKINDEMTVEEFNPEIDPDLLFWKDIREQVLNKEANRT